MVTSVSLLSDPLIYPDPIFGIMGAKKGIEYEIRPFEVFGIYPIVIIAVIAASALLTSLLTKRVSSSDTADIE